ncbi:MAG: DUF1559 domain-containing protein, partial [Planctomycetaceae bacterium]|nr:DUF1559 domain-containing protein [Planctomycetaceae bacterium]
PSCFTSGGPTGGAGHLASATSNHSGGVNIGLGDGSVRFAGNTINCGNTSLPPVQIGVSPYGIWGALGSCEGRESASLP